jgi:AcrR family transcriptional regulator
VVKIKPSARPLDPDQRYDANIDHILRAAASVFAEKSFGLASIRDIAAHARISFPRIYYYLRNKEELLYLISHRAFEELLKRGEEASRGPSDAGTRLRRFIEGHLGYHMDNLAEMKVLVRESDTLVGSYAADIARLKRDYSRICQRTIEQVAAANGKKLDPEQSRIVTSLLFGAMNWFYTWYDPERDGERRERIMDEVFRLAAGSLAAD